MTTRIQTTGGPITWKGTCACLAKVTVKCPTHTPQASHEYDIECPNCGCSELTMRKVG